MIDTTARSRARFDVGALAPIRVRREPETTVLYRVLAAHLETFVARTAADERRAGLPGFVVRELRAFLRCGLLAHGFCRVHCAACGTDALVAFSCKGRGVCPSCGARRMAETAAHLVDRVFPDVAVRQWVLALPHRVRFLCAYDPVLCRRIRKIFVRGIAAFYQRRARERGLRDPRTGCVVFTQRFDSALRLNVHFHGLWLDGTFECASRAPRAEADFHPDLSPTDADVDRLVRTLRQRILRFLRKAGKLDEDDGLADLHDDEPPLLAILAAAAVQGKSALGPNAGTYAPRLGRGSADGGEFRRGKLCADAEGFSLHAGVRIGESCRERLEKLCRYAARPPVVHDRLQLRPDGKILYKLKRRYRDGSTHVVLEPLALLERLAALIPRPRVNLTTYHGILAPAASYRDCVVPAPVDEVPNDNARSCAHSQAQPRTDATPTPSPCARPRTRYSWAELLQRVFLIDVLTCDRCGGRRKLLAAITEPKTVRSILAHLGLATEPPVIALARAPPRDLFG